MVASALGWERSAVFWALPLGVAAFARRFGWQRAGLWMLFWCLAALGPGELTRARSYAQLRQQWLAEVVPCLNQEAPMAASDVLIPHLATRAWISYPYDLRQHPSGEPDERGGGQDQPVVDGFVPRRVRFRAAREHRALVADRPIRDR